jgi:hypothetical protein
MCFAHHKLETIFHLVPISESWMGFAAPSHCDTFLDSELSTVDMHSFFVEVFTKGL